MDIRQKPSIPEADLRACFQEQYGLIPVTLEFLPLGYDFSAGVYRVVSEQGASYLLKVKPGSLYEASCFVPAYLRNQGVAAVVAPLPTKRKTMWTQVGEWTVIVYPFYEGETDFTGMMDEQWKELGRVFKQIHQVPLPPEGFESVRTETFDPTEYARWLRDFEAQYAYSAGGSVSERVILSSWAEHQSTIHRLVSAMEKLAVVLQSRSGPYVICHADLHPANLIRNHSGQVFVIDWDDVKLAPKERDFIYAGKAPEVGSARQDVSPFFQGYGETEIDWIALTYYRFERPVQDLVECAKNVFFMDDFIEETKAHEAQLFYDILAEREDINAAYATAAHIPADLAL